MNGIRIVSNGTPVGTHIYNSASGEEIQGVQELTIVATPKGMFAKVTIVVSSIDAIVDEKDVELTKRKA